MGNEKAFFCVLCNLAMTHAGVWVYHRDLVELSVLRDSQACVKHKTSNCGYQVP